MPYTPITAIPLRAASVQNRTGTGRDPIPATGFTRQLFRWPHLIAGNVETIRLSFFNWYFTGSELENSNAVTIIEASLEKNGSGKTVPVTFNGSRSITLATSASDVQSDPIEKTSFTGGFPDGTIVWVKGIVEVPTGGGVVATPFLSGAYSGSQAAWFNPSTATISSTDAPGAYTGTGLNIHSRINGFGCVLLANGFTYVPSWISIGDSIMEGLVEANLNGIYGQGFMQRAVGGASVSSIPLINISKSGIPALAFNNGTKWRDYIKYGKYAVDELIGNDIGVTNTVPFATLQARAQANWTILVANGIQGIVRTKNSPRTTSTDNWTTAANQTVRSGWNVGENAILFNDWLDTKVLDSTLLAAVNFTDVKDPVTPTKWKTDGVTPFLMTGDDVHPSTNGHTLMGAQLRTVIAALP